MKAMAKSPDNLSVLLDMSIDRSNDDTFIHIAALEAAIDVIQEGHALLTRSPVRVVKHVNGRCHGPIDR